jgi:hypothetical protein
MTREYEQNDSTTKSSYNREFDAVNLVIGDPKIWYIIHPNDTVKFKELVKSKFFVFVHFFSFAD